MSIFKAVHRALRGRHVKGFSDAARHAGAVVPRLPRIETVDTGCIVGSVGRAHELGHNFRPTRRRGREHDNERFQTILKAMKRGRALPAVQLYRVGSEYYVLDGHHRVAAAITLGQLAIDAHVTEFQPGASV